MSAMIVIGAVVLALLLIGAARTAVDAAYQDGRLILTARLGMIPIRVNGESAGKKKRAPKGKGETPPEKKRRKLPPWPLLEALLKNGYNTLCRVVSRLRVDILKIHFTSAWEDPCITAMAYAGAGTAMETLLQLGESRIARPDLLAVADFDGSQPVIDCHIRLSVRLYQLLGAAACFGFGFLRDYMRLKKKGSKNHGKSTDRGPDGNSNG